MAASSTPPPLRGWIDLGFSPSFAVKKLLLMLAASMIPLALCLAARQGLLGMFAMSVGFWPYRFRFRVDARGLRISWWFLDEWVKREDIQSATVVPDPRRFVIGTRRPVLLLQRRARRPATIRADEQTLERLSAQIRSLGDPTP
jgi:hypothetical protein